MDRLNMKLVDLIINKNKKGIGTKSNKNLTEDMIIELAEVIGANTCLLKEECNPNKPYSFCELDVPLISEMIEKAKTKEGKRLRCKDYKNISVDIIEFYSKAFLQLYKNNGVDDHTIHKEFLKMLHRSEFMLLIDKVKKGTDKFNDDIDRFFFAPNDNFPDEDDQLTITDKLVFLHYMYKHLDMSSEESR